MFELLHAKSKKKWTRWVGDVGLGVIGGGFLSSVLSNTTAIYDFPTDVVSEGSALSVARYGLASSGNAAIGLFAGGNTTSAAYETTIESYDFVNHSVGLCQSLQVRRSYAGSTANETVAIFRNGKNSSYPDITQTEKYTFSSGVISVGSASAYKIFAGASCGNMDYGVFDKGQIGNGGTTGGEKYRYSNDTQTAATLMTTSTHQYTYRAAAGNDTYGIFAGGGGSSSENYTDKYIYSSNVRVLSSKTPTGFNQGVGFSNQTKAIFGRSAMYKFNFSDEKFYTGSSLGADRRSGAACSSSPGWII